MMFIMFHMFCFTFIISNNALPWIQSNIIFEIKIFSIETQTFEMVAKKEVHKFLGGRNYRTENSSSFESKRRATRMSVD